MTTVSNKTKIPTVAFDFQPLNENQGAGNDYRVLAVVFKDKNNTSASATEASADKKVVYNVSTQDQVDELFGEKSHASYFYKHYARTNSEPISLVAMTPSNGTDGYKQEVSFEFAANPTNGIAKISFLNKTLEVKFTSEMSKTDALNKIVNEFAELFDDLPYYATFQKTGDNVKVENSKAKVTIVSSCVSTALEALVFTHDNGTSGIRITKTNGSTYNSQNPESDRFKLALEAIGEETFDFIALPFNYTKAIEKFVAWVEPRHEPVPALDGIGFYVLAESELATSYTSPAQSPYIVPSLLASTEGRTPQLASSIGTLAQKAMADPARPLQNVEIKGVTPLKSIAVRGKRELALRAGVSTFISESGDLLFERVVTAEDSNGTFSDFNDFFTSIIMRRLLVRKLRQAFPNKKLGNDADAYTATSNVVTPKVIKGEIISIMKEWLAAGWIETDGSLPNSVDVVKNGDGVTVDIDINLINQLRIIVGNLSIKE